MREITQILYSSKSFVIN